MASLHLEIKTNFNRFSKTWMDELKRAARGLSADKNKYEQSYRRLVSLQAWRNDVIERTCGPESVEFFLEAQNDALVSHVFASLGAWRSALQALRSTIENVTLCLFYKDHPVELQLWNQGLHKLSFKNGWDYLCVHPQFRGVSPDVTGLNIVNREYSKLSLAVHAASKNFRMTMDSTSPRLWLLSQPNLGKWLSRESQTICGLNLLLISMFRNELTGAHLPALRKLIGLAVPSRMHARVKSKLGVRLS